MPKRPANCKGANCGATGKQPDWQTAPAMEASCEPEEYWIVDDIEGRLDRRTIAGVG